MLRSEPFLTCLALVDATPEDEMPLVFSTFSGEDPSDELPSRNAARLDLEFIKSGLRGISLGSSGSRATPPTVALREKIQGPLVCLFAFRDGRWRDDDGKDA